ncbi:hypothetical protein DACRYDRAFT_107440 [Dacryopinax primogenitus]|uniref:Uncharacterized protein n=1 Tax=Dacryopinax primogenitus (strain DJM 731) TaxID=1858805 RepID=M5G7A3_DACPD|nr:uncharacterized protein DACRYDRAFT_107440 [Dacryopinax primogenitus]EJU01692.1 hypothetical protein DACRYDRAFT_107440 [Dacryopinax primogenitus]
MAAEFDASLNPDHLHGDRLSIMDICLSPKWPISYFTKVKVFKNLFRVLCENPIPCDMCGSNKVGQRCTGGWNYSDIDWKGDLKRVGQSCDSYWCKGYSCSFIVRNKEPAGESSKMANSKRKVTINLTGDNMKKPNKRAKSGTVKMEGELSFTIPDVVVSMEMAWRDVDSPAFLKYSGTFHKSFCHHFGSSSDTFRTVQCLHRLIHDSKRLHIAHAILSESFHVLHANIKRSGELDDDNFPIIVAPQNAREAADAIYHIKRGEPIPMVNEELEKAQAAYHHRHDNSSKKGESSCQVDKGKQWAKCEIFFFSLSDS